MDTSPNNNFYDNRSPVNNQEIIDRRKITEIPYGSQIGVAPSAAFGSSFVQPNAAFGSSFVQPNASSGASFVQPNASFGSSFVQPGLQPSAAYSFPINTNPYDTKPNNPDNTVTRPGDEMSAGRKSRKSKKSNKSRKSRKSKKSNKSRKSRK